MQRKLVLIWALDRVGGEVRAGTIPGSLLRSADLGRRWQLVDTLWRRSGRLAWFGGGYPARGIHSSCAHPTAPGQTLLGIGCGGVCVPHDDGRDWALSAKGMVAGFMPPEMTGNQNIQDAHRIQRCAAQPDLRQRRCGRRRHTVSQQLPPIAAVRFG